MKGIVWGLTFNDAKIKLLDIEERYRPYTNIVTKRNTNLFLKMEIDGLLVELAIIVEDIDVIFLM